jgi:hypothetical protein
MKAGLADFWIAAAIVLIPAADCSHEHIDLHGGTMVEETAFFYDFDIDGAGENSRWAACQHGTPAGGLGDSIEDDVVTRNIQPAERSEIPRDALRMFVEECDDPTESGDTITPFSRLKGLKTRRFYT